MPVSTTPTTSAAPPSSLSSSLATARRGATLLAVAVAAPLALPMLLPFVTTSPVSAVPTVLAVVGQLFVVVGGWWLAAAPGVRWPWRVVVVVVGLLALGGAALRLDDAPLFDVLIEGAHRLSYAATAAEVVIALLGWTIERRLRPGGASPAWLIVVLLELPLFLSFLAQHTILTSIGVGLVSMVRSAVLVLALLLLRGRLR